MDSTSNNPYDRVTLTPIHNGVTDLYFHIKATLQLSNSQVNFSQSTFKYWINWTINSPYPIWDLKWTSKFSRTPSYPVFTSESFSSTDQFPLSFTKKSSQNANILVFDNSHKLSYKAFSFNKLYNQD